MTLKQDIYTRPLGQAFRFDKNRIPMTEIQACRHRKFLAFFVCVCMSFSSITLAQSGQSKSSGPAAERFAMMLNTLEERKRKDPEASRKSTYDLLTVKIENWYATEEARFAHALKIPNPVPVDSGYLRGMTQQQYFEHLCKTEAGEFIYKTADNVAGVFQMRPRRIRYDGATWQHLYAIEDPYGHWEGENERYGYEFVKPLLYEYIEVPSWGRPRYKPHQMQYRDYSLLKEPATNESIAHYFGYDGKDFRSLQLEFDSKPKARYGFTWRGIKRPYDREMGIAGGELIVLDLQTHEVMGVRRGYVIWNGGWTGRVCPRYGYDGGQDKATYFSAWYLAKVVKPKQHDAFFEMLEKTRRIRGDTKDKRY
jgi:hypothetical protein